MNRRAFIATVPALAAARSLLAAAKAPRSHIGLCTFSCHQHWSAVEAKFGGVQFRDALSFYEYARSLGAEGVQTALRSADPGAARRIRRQVKKDGGYFEAELSLPRNKTEVDAFEAGVRLAREAGATLARVVCLGGRRYEVFKSLEDFRRFEQESTRALQLAEPPARRHRLKLAIENHKDHTSDELIALLRLISSEWLGVLVDTGNNLALCEEPHAIVEALAPFALSVHLKDMAVQPADDGFLLSEVPLGAGMLDLPRLIAALRGANPAIAFNLEMATRDPLRVPCRTDTYWATFPERKAARLDSTLELVRENPPKQPPPSVTGKSLPQRIAEEESNNRQGLTWMRQNIRA
jgi:sugar phosphate isomerase/epimerase